MASKRRYDDNEEEDGSQGLGFGYQKPAEKKMFSGGDSAGSSLNFISFTKAGTNLDGSSSSVDNKYKPSDRAALMDLTGLEVVGNIDNNTLEQAAIFLEKFHFNLKRNMQNFNPEKNSLTGIFNNVTQVNNVEHSTIKFTYLYI